MENSSIGVLGGDSTAAVQLDGCGADGWYNWESGGPYELILIDGPYDLILIDGPQGEGNRGGVLRVIDRLVHDETVIVVDDVQQVAEREMAEEITLKLGRAEMYEGGVFATID